MLPAAIVDAHVHFWQPTRLRYPWLAGVPALDRAWVPADFAAACAGTGPGGGTVERWVFVESGRDPVQNVEEAAWVSELAVDEPRIAAIVAHAAVERGAAVGDELDALARYPLVKGVRRLLQDEAEDAFCLRPGFVEGVRAVGERGWTFDLCIYHRQLPAVLELVRRCPGTVFVLDHAGKPAIRERRLDPWREQLRALASLPNVWCKVSGLATEADPAAWEPADLRPYLEHVLGCFGFGRTLFGGDWPVATLATEYRRWVGVVAELPVVVAATLAERQRLFADNAAAVYRLAAV